jgi:hypothetical protein
MNSQPVIGILSGVQGDTRRYRAFHLWQQLRIAGVNTTISHLNLESAISIFEQSNILILQRVSWDSFVEKIIKTAKQRFQKEATIVIIVLVLILLAIFIRKILKAMSII